MPIDQTNEPSSQLLELTIKTPSSKIYLHLTSEAEEAYITLTSENETTTLDLKTSLIKFLEGLFRIDVSVKELITLALNACEVVNPKGFVALIELSKLKALLREEGEKDKPEYKPNL